MKTTFEFKKCSIFEKCKSTEHCKIYNQSELKFKLKYKVEYYKFEIDINQYTYICRKILARRKTALIEDNSLR